MGSEEPTRKNHFVWVSSLSQAKNGQGLVKKLFRLPRMLQFIVTFWVKTYFPQRNKDDNDPKQTERKTKEWLRENNIKYWSL